MMRWGLSSSSRRVEARCRGGEFSRRPVTILGRTANALYSFRNQGNGEVSLVKTSCALNTFRISNIKEQELACTGQDVML